MLPKSSEDLQQFVFTTQPSKTYRINIEKERIGGTADKLEAVKQAVYKVLNTERYDNLIYSWNYGIELKELFGQPKDYVISELPRRIREALIQDDRIEDVTDFSFEENRRGALSAYFQVHSTEGVFNTELEVKI